MEEYLTTLLEQIRCKKARPYIKEELKSHLEDQIDDNMESGMDYETAEKAAMKDMGDPVETGISLDHVHKPQVAWRLIGLVVLISLIGILIHTKISKQMIKYKEIPTNTQGSSQYILYVILGLTIMMAIVWIDYTVIARYSKIIAAVMIGVCMFAVIFGDSIGGAVRFVGIGRLKGSISSFMMLYVPVYGAVVYQYHGLGYGGFLKSILWMVVPGLLILKLQNLMLVSILLVSMLVVLTIAVCNHWFQITKKRAILGLWLGIAGFPAISLVGMYLFHMLPMYQETRLHSFLTNSGETNYLTSLLRSFYSSGKLIGSNQTDVMKSLPSFQSDYIFTYLTTSYGYIAGIAVCCILVVLILMIFGAATHQKNQLGMVMGCGCGMILLTNFVINVLQNIGALPITNTYLPFFSAGGSNIVMSYILVGIVLSIYRYKNIYPRDVKKKVSIVKAR